jgi:hypothetical protein
MGNVTYNRTTVTAGEPVEIKATVSNFGTAEGRYDPYLRSDGDIVSQGPSERVIPPGRSETFTFTHTFAEPGSTVLELRHDYLDRLDVAAPPATTTAVTPFGTDGATLRVEHAREGTPVNITLPERTASNGSGVQFERLSLRTDRPRSLDLQARQVRTAADFDVADRNVRPVSALTVEGTGEAALSEVTLQFGVDRTAHPDIGPGAVTVHHVTDEGVTTVDPTLVERSDGQYRYRATLAGASTYVVGVRDPSFTVTNATVVEPEVGLWEGVDVRATIRNDGGSGTYHVPIMVNGTVQDTQAVNVRGNTSRTVTLTFPGYPTGEHPVAVGATQAGNVTIGTVTAAGPAWQAMIPFWVHSGGKSPADLITEDPEIETTGLRTPDGPTNETTVAPRTGDRVTGISAGLSQAGGLGPLAVVLALAGLSQMLLRRSRGA